MTTSILCNNEQILSIFNNNFNLIKTGYGGIVKFTSNLFDRLYTWARSEYTWARSGYTWARECKYNIYGVTFSSYFRAMHKSKKRTTDEKEFHKTRIAEYEKKFHEYKHSLSECEKEFHKTRIAEYEKKFFHEYKHSLSEYEQIIAESKKGINFKYEQAIAEYEEVLTKYIQVTNEQRKIDSELKQIMDKYNQGIEFKLLINREHILRYRKRSLKEQEESLNKQLNLLAKNVESVFNHIDYDKSKILCQEMINLHYNLSKIAIIANLEKAFFSLILLPLGSKLIQILNPINTLFLYKFLNLIRGFDKAKKKFLELIWRLGLNESKLPIDIKDLLLRKKDDDSKFNALVFFIPLSCYDYNNTIMVSITYVLEFLKRVNCNIDVDFPISFKNINHALTKKDYKYIFFMGHGSSDSITFLPNFKLLKENIYKLDFSRTFLNSIIYLHSCHTGASNGIAEKIADHTNKIVFAPMDAGGINLEGERIFWTDENNEDCTIKIVPQAVKDFLSTLR